MPTIYFHHAKVHKYWILYVNIVLGKGKKLCRSKYDIHEVLWLFWIRFRVCSNISSPCMTQMHTKSAGKHTCSLPAHPWPRPKREQHPQQHHTHNPWGAWGRPNGWYGHSGVWYYGGLQEEDMGVPQWTGNVIVHTHDKHGQIPTNKGPHQTSKIKSM